MSTQTHGDSRRVCEVMDLIAQYVLKQGWVPVGQRTFTIGPWEIAINGGRESWQEIPPFHARIENTEYVAIMIVSPFGGTVGGWKGAEDQFCADLRTELQA